MPRVLNFKVMVEQDEDGVFVARVPAIPGCHSDGKTYEQALENVQEVVELCLEVAGEDQGYRDKIDWSDAEDRRGGFLGITEIPVKVNFAV